MTSVTSVVDASALLALLFDEPGAVTVAEVIAAGATMSAVNVAEVATVLVRSRRDPEKLLRPVRAQVDVEPFTDDDALAVALLYPQVSAKGLSPGDRTCLALAQRLGVAAVTAEHLWTDLAVDVAVQVVRPPDVSADRRARASRTRGSPAYAARVGRG